MINFLLGLKIIISVSTSSEHVIPHVDEVISTLSNESRLKILFKLKHKPEKISILAKTLTLNLQDTHRNIHKMVETRILQKDPEGFISLAPTGEMITILFPSFDFVIKNDEYFEDHIFNTLPKKFVQRLGVLHTCELVSGVTRVLERWKIHAQEVEKFKKVISSQVPLEAIEVTLQKLNQGLSLKLILGKNTIFPDSFSDLLKKYNVSKLELNGFFEQKVIENVGFYLVISEKEASISFPNKKGNVDIGYAFFGKNEEFLEWCNELFDEVWSKEAQMGKSF
jgi:predicted transcriptional regulator